MAKRGEKLPWKVEFEWQDGPKGKVAYATQDRAQLEADKITRAGEVQERVVTVKVYRTS